MGHLLLPQTQDQAVEFLLLAVIAAEKFGVSCADAKIIKECSNCDGTGRVHSHNPNCWECNGTGKIKC